MSFSRSLLVGLFILLSSSNVLAQEVEEDSHIAVENPAELSHLDANTIYDKLKDQLAEMYALANLVEIEDYQKWTRSNSAPYISATHGQRFVNNYVNEAGKSYNSLKKGSVFPLGTVLAKDSITVTDDGKQFMGAMFVMEKLAAGRNPETADWRYIMVLPDGTLYGDTMGDDPKQMRYCHTCHKVKSDQDYVFGVPEDYRDN